MNVLTFDIEEWVIESHSGNRKEQYVKFDSLLDNILEQLYVQGIKATFFCLGELARKFPYIVTQIDRQGHEIGCHSDTHLWLNKMTRNEAEEDTRRAVCSLEELIGKKVISYRAPAFSIGASNKWAFEVLADCGIKIDASVFPAVRDFGGFAEFGKQEPSLVSYGDTIIKEFPIPLTNVLGKQLAFSGGGYFRFFPLNFIQKEIKERNYIMTYFHIGDLMAENKGIMTKVAYEKYFKEKGTLLNRYKRYVKSNLGTKSAFQKLKTLISTTNFISIEEADKIIDWGTTSIVKI